MQKSAPMHSAISDEMPAPISPIGRPVSHPRASTNTSGTCTALIQISRRSASAVSPAAENAGTAIVLTASGISETQRNTR